MILGVAEGLIVAALVGLAGWLTHNGYLSDALNLCRSIFLPQQSAAAQKLALPDRKLLRALLRDQSFWGWDYGQFGSSASLAESGLWNRTTERLSTKPRMYLTSWPCRVLQRRQIAPRALERAKRGVQRLFVKGYILGTEGWTLLPGRARRTLTNYRHTMCGALILLELQGWSDLTSMVVSRMLAKDSQWQNGDGGWVHTGPLSGPSDLYSTLYAIQLLYQTKVSNGAPAELAEAVADRLERSLDYVEVLWHANGWAYDLLTAEEVFPLVFVEVCDALKTFRPSLHSAVVKRLLVQVSAGIMSEGYRIRVGPDVPDERLQARLAYAIYRAGQARSVWSGIAASALEGDIGVLNSAEAAFLLDMVWTD